LAACGAKMDYGQEYIELSQNLPKRWALSSLPINLKVTSSLDTDSFNSIAAMGQQWNDANSEDVDFFNTTHTAVEKNYAHADTYLDNEMGIYNLTSWPEPLPSEALAVTQTFSNVKTDAFGNKYVEVFHVDILINNEHHNVNNVKTFGSYYLQTIMLHEMGHTLGLRHYSDYEYSSVMVPSISTLHSFNTLYAYDVDTINNKYYGVSEGSGRVMAATARAEDVRIESSLIEGTNIIRTIYEIRESGCPHK
jgi:hypothetical protein